MILLKFFRQSIKEAEIHSPCKAFAKFLCVTNRKIDDIEWKSHTSKMIFNNLETEPFFAIFAARAYLPRELPAAHKI